MTPSDNKGKIYCIPSSLSIDADHVIPEYVRTAIAHIMHFVVENERTARRFLRRIGYKGDFDQGKMLVLDKRSKAADMAPALQWLQSGKDVGLLSEAGCPGIADPGCLLVEQAQRAGIHVKPMVGPSSILLGLMASGFNGQNFAFHGYLPIKTSDRIKVIRRMEGTLQKSGQTQIFMETPYRNVPLLSDLVYALQERTMLCVASDLTTENEQILSLPIGTWKSYKENDLKEMLHKRPAIFLMGKC